MTTKRKARQEGKALIMYADPLFAPPSKLFKKTGSFYLQTKIGSYANVPFAVLTLSESADAARIEAGAKAIARYYAGFHADSLMEFKAVSRAVITAIGALSTPARSTKQG